jgi:hypothetical protein
VDSHHGVLYISELEVLGYVRLLYIWENIEEMEWNEILLLAYCRKIDTSLWKQLVL